MTTSDVYRQFIDFEERAAAIYADLASHFSQNSDLSSFWLEMALHEKQHAELLQFCVCEQLFVQHPPDKEELKKLNALFTRLAKDASETNLSVEAAFRLAMELEASEINTIYCCITASLHSSMYLFRRKIATILPNHVDELIATARKLGIAERSLQTLHQANQKCSDQSKG